MNDILLQFWSVCCLYIEYTWVFIYWLVFYKYANLIYMSLSEGNATQYCPIFLPGEFQKQRSQAGFSPWGHKELDRTKWLIHTLICTSGVFVDSLGFSLYIIIYSEVSLSFSLPTVVCFHYFLPYCTCESFQSNVEKK